MSSSSRPVCSGTPEIERGMVDGLAEVTDDEAREQRGRRAKPDAPDLHAAERHAGAADEGDHADRDRKSTRLNSSH